MKTKSDYYWEQARDINSAAYNDNSRRSGNSAAYNDTGKEMERSPGGRRACSLAGAVIATAARAWPRREARLAPIGEAAGGGGSGG
jgi:hypothetical protein